MDRLGDEVSERIVSPQLEKRTIQRSAGEPPSSFLLIIAVTALKEEYKQSPPNRSSPNTSRISR